MLYPYISQFNWIDIIIIICIVRMCYVGLKTGVGVEIFKTLGLLFCAFIALHFYIIIGSFLNSKMPPLPVEPASIFCYVVLVTIVTLLFRILREGFFAIVKSETISLLSKWLGLFLGFLRGILVSGFMLYGLLISTNHYCDLSVRTSYFGLKAAAVPIKIYEGVYNGAISKIFPDQPFNSEPIRVLESTPKA